MFLWWIFTADMFNVKSRTFLDFPLDISEIDRRAYKRLSDVGQRLVERFDTPGDHILWTPYAGEWYGNYDLNRCRDITDEADEILRGLFGLDGCEEEFEVEYRNYMKSGGERPGTVRGAMPDRDR